MAATIHTPSIVKVSDNSDTSSTFTIEPLHSGYGNTLGNSLRRVLLSSISGAAITSFKVDGASHEFTALPGVKEDVVDIMLNLKGLRFKVYSEDAVTLTISKSGSGPVTGKDIIVNSDVEVANPEHVIANLDGSKAKLSMEIIVEAGRGYRPIEQFNSKKLNDFIALDAIFSPVTRVRYTTEHTRVGQITDLDRLLLTVDTDGTISPRDAFEEAAAILINQYTALAGKTRVESEPMIKATSVDYAQAADEPMTDESAVLDTSVEDLNLSARTTNALVNNEIHTIKDLFSLSDAEMRELKGFGSKALDEVKEKLAELEL